MNIKVKELLQEKYEVISRAADDCTYILMDDTLTKEDLEHKIYTRLDRINSESQNIEEILKRYFAPPTGGELKNDPNIVLIH